MLHTSSPHGTTLERGINLPFWHYFALVLSAIILTISMALFLLLSELITELTVTSSNMCNPIRCYGAVLPPDDLDFLMDPNAVSLPLLMSALNLQGLKFRDGPLRRIVRWRPILPGSQEKLQMEPRQAALEPVEIFQFPLVTPLYTFTPSPKTMCL